MSDTTPASGLPKIRTYSDFDVFSGFDGLSRDEYKKATFSTSSDNGDNASFRKKAEQMESSGSEIEADADRNGTPGDKEEQAKTKKEANEAAL